MVFFFYCLMFCTYGQNYKFINTTSENQTFCHRAIFSILNITLSDYPQVEIWSNRLMQRPAWQATQQSPEVIQNWLKRIQKLSKLPERQWQQRR